MSLDPGNSKDDFLQTLTLTKGLYLIENFDALDKLPARRSILFCESLRIKNGTDSPARIVALPRWLTDNLVDNRLLGFCRTTVLGA